MLQVRYSIHLNFNRYGDLLLHFLGRAPRPLRDDLDVIIRYVGVGFHWQIVKRNGAPKEQKYRHHHDDETVLQRVFDEFANHRLIPASHRRVPARSASHCSTVFCSTRALVTTCCPARTPVMISCMLFGSVSPAVTSTRRNVLFPAGMYTQSLSCRCNIASAGTAACISFFSLWNVAVTNIPILINPGFSTSIRTFAVRRLGSRIGPMLPIRPLNTLSGYAFKRTSAISPTCTLARSFS